MNPFSTIKKLSIWIFIVPFVAVNACLIFVIYFQQFLNPGDGIGPTFPYFDGGTSISRTARVFPTYLIFKPAMFLTAFFLFKFWSSYSVLVNKIDEINNYSKYFKFFGMASALMLVLHSIFLGIKFDIQIYKLFRRVVMLSFVIFEITAQTLLVLNFYKIRSQLTNLISKKILIFKIILVSVLVVTAIASMPFLAMDGYKNFKHALEWDYFLGVLLFYLLSHFFWLKNPGPHTQQVSSERDKG